MNWKELRNLWFPNWKALRNVELPARTSAYPVFVAACVVPGDSRSVVEKSTDEIWNFVVRFLLPSVDLVPSCAVFREIRWKTGCWERGEGSKLNCCWHSTYSRSSCGESGTTRNRRKRLRSKFFLLLFCADGDSLSGLEDDFAERNRRNRLSLLFDDVWSITFPQLLVGFPRGGVQFADSVGIPWWLHCGGELASLWVCRP